MGTSRVVKDGERFWRDEVSGTTFLIDLGLICCSLSGHCPLSALALVGTNTTSPWNKEAGDRVTAAVSFFSSNILAMLSSPPELRVGALKTTHPGSLGILWLQRWWVGSSGMEKLARGHLGEPL